MTRCLAGLAALLFAACAGPGEPLVVKQFQLRDTDVEAVDDPMVRAEKQRRLHGAVSLRERRERIGQYYTLLWSHSEGAGAGEVELRFEFQQGGSGSRVLRREARFSAEEAEGRADFEITGDDFFDNGRVLAWRASLWRGGREVAAKSSYLWQ